MQTSSRNIAKLREALQNMYSAEFLQITASDIAITSTFSNGCLETSSKKFHHMIKISEAATERSYPKEEFLKLSKNMKSQ